VGTILKIVRPLYGVPEAGNHWFQTYQCHHCDKLGMAQSMYNPCLLFTPGDTNGTGFGIVGMQTDNTLLLADGAFAEAEETELHKARFLSKEREELTAENPIKFNGGQLTMKENFLELTQERHCENLGTILPEAVNLTSSHGTVRKSVLPKGQYVAQ
jgi:hypothetical protein